MTQDDKPLEEMVGALTDAVIVFPSGWEETMPEQLKKELPLHRLIHLMRCLEGKESWEEACDLEALMYLYPASLAFPLDQAWSHIYLYLGTKCLGDRLPQDIKQDGLNSYEAGLLRDLKRWIQRKKIEARKGKVKGQKTAMVQTVSAQYEQMMMGI